MQIFEHISFLSQAILRALSPAADTCQFNILWPQLPEPLLSLGGQCIPDSDCEGYKTTGFCRGAASILCCTDTFANDNGMATSPGQLSSWGYDLIKAFEGWKDDFYCDNATGTTGHTHCNPGEGVLTIGYGHACQPESNCQSIIDEPRPITEARGTEILTADVHVMEAAAAAITGPLTQDQFDAIISYIFNVGPGPGHVRPLADAINTGDYATAENAIRNGIGDKKRRSVEANVFISF